MRAPTIEEVMKPYLRYPKVIQQAILRAETHPAFSILTKSGKRVLKDLMTRVCKSNAEEPIKANLEKIASDMQVSYKTVQRAVSALIGAGWLLKQMDNVMGERGNFGLFKSIQYRFTPEFCKIVELPFVDENGNSGNSRESLGNNSGKGDENNDGQKMSDRSYIDFIDLTFTKDQQEISLKNKKNKTPITLPTELCQFSQEFQIEKSLICKARGHAHSRGHKLEDICKVAQERLKAIGVTGWRVYKYLLSMIVKNADYAGRAAQAGRIADVKPKKPSKVAENLKKSHEINDKKLIEETAKLPQGRAAGAAFLQAFLKRGKIQTA